MRFAVVGDIHGEYRLLAEVLAGVVADVGPLDFIVSVGDAEPNRSQEDAAGIHTPAKYRRLGEFPQVLSGEITLPAPFYFIGGNHDPWPALDAHGPGEWAPGFHFLGRGGGAEVQGVTLAFLSGVYSPKVSEGVSPREGKRRATYWTPGDVSNALWEGRPPEGRGLDILVTHEWPSGIGTDRHGVPAGRPEVRRLVEELRPRFHVCGHMHHCLQAEIGPTQVLCLDHIHGRERAVAVFETAGGAPLRASLKCAKGQSPTWAAPWS